MTVGPDNALVPKAGPISIRQRRPSFADAFFRKFAPNEPIHEDNCVRVVVPRGWGMQQLEVLVQPDIDADRFEKIDREDQRIHMHEYFASDIKIIPARERHDLLPDTRLAADIKTFVSWFLLVGLVALLVPLVVLAAATHSLWLLGAAILIALASTATYWFLTGLVAQLSTDRIWPGLMEERLSKAIKDKFQTTDIPIRHVIDRYVDLFLDNNWMFLRLKRLLQAGAIIGLYVAVAPAVSFSLVAPQLLSPIVLGVCAVWAVVTIVVTMWTFNGLNDHIYDNKYLQTLQNSAQHVSTLVRNRMAAIYSLYQHTLRHITELQQKGEPTKGLKDDVRVIDDIELTKHEGFFALQTMIWLAKRTEYIELHLHNRIHHALTVQAVLSIAGFVSCLALFVAGIAPAAGLAVASLAHLSASTSWIALALETGAGLVVLCGSAWLSWESYFEDAWNPLKTRVSEESILDEHFDTKDLGGWQTFKKIKLDVNLAGVFQKTLGIVSDLFQKLGPRA